MVEVRGSKPLPRTSFRIAWMDFPNRNFPLRLAALLFSFSYSCAVSAEQPGEITEPRNASRYVRVAPHPEYPAEARLRHMSGSGLALLKIDRHSGRVTSATMLRTTGHAILDDAALRAYRAWRFQPGKISELRLPTVFTMTGVPLEQINAAADAINAPRPKYPSRAQIAGWTGQAVVLMEVDYRTGRVSSARLLKSTGHEILDESAMDALRRWQFRPRTWSPVRVPVTFTRQGVNFE
jgi:TonB family protein